MKKFVILSALAFTCLVLSGCGDSPGETPRTSAKSPAAVPAPVRLDEAGLISAVGSPVVYEYEIEDGRGLNFRTREHAPSFKLEFRKNRERTNVAWDLFYDTPKFREMDAENLRWAGQVLTYALGAESSARIMQVAMQADKPLSFKQGGHKIDVVAPSQSGVLVMIYPLETP